MNIQVKVKAGCKKENIQKLSDNEYVISVREKAEDNKANLAVVKLLSKYFKRKAKIRFGLKNKNKIISLE